MIINAITKPLGLLYDLAKREGDVLGMVAAQALLQTWHWHKFIVAPLTLEQEDFSVPFDYAEQLREHGLFRLPFDEIVIQFGPADLMQILFDSERERTGLQPEFCVATVQHKDGVLEGRIFQTFSNCPIFSNFGRVILPLSTGQRDKELTVDEYATFVPDFLPDLKHAEHHACSQKILFTVAVFTFVGLINADGIVQEHHRAPKFINKKREAKGKLPLFEYHLLKISPSLKLPGHTALGGMHASPRLHWRRGHIRRLPSGMHTQVRPCLVGHKSLGQIKKDYLVGGDLEGVQ